MTNFVTRLVRGIVGALLLACSLSDASWIGRQNLNLKLPSNYDASNDLLCHVFVETVASHDTVSGQWFSAGSYFECQLIEVSAEGAQSYTKVAGRRIVIPKDVAKNNKPALLAGKWFVVLRDSRKHLVSDTATLEPSSANILTLPVVSTSKSNREIIRSRSLANVDVRSVLVLRISTTDSSPSFSASELLGLIFNDTAPSLRAQTYWCSSGKLLFAAPDFGVLDVSLPTTAAGSSNRDIVQAAYSAANKLLGVAMLENEYDHVMFCVPPGTNGNWAAAAPVHHWRSVYNDKWCGYISGYMHEIGHNLGLLHAYENGIPYKDSSGYMSSGFLTTQWPQKCYNAQNHWLLGWFQDREVDVTAIPGTPPQLYSLATFVDYDKTSPNEVVIIRIDKIFYLHFNRAKNYNQDTQMNPNSVTMVEFMDGFPGTALLAGLNPQTQPYQIPNYKGAQSALVIDVCSMITGSSSTPDIAVMSIGYGSSLCSAYRNGQVTVPPLSPSIPAPPAVGATPTPVAPPTPFPVLAAPLQFSVPSLSPVFVELSASQSAPSGSTPVKSPISVTNGPSLRAATPQTSNSVAAPYQWTTPSSPTPPTQPPQPSTNLGAAMHETSVPTSISSSTDWFNTTIFSAQQSQAHQPNTVTSMNAESTQFTSGGSATRYKASFMITALAWTTCLVVPFCQLWL